jgi:ABC exporter DevB family membrane fusion protein
MSSRRPKWTLAVVLLLSAGCAVLIVRTALAGPQNVPGPRDVDNARRVVVPESGGDERTLLVDGDYVAGNGIVEPRDREIKVDGESPGRIAAVRVKEGEHVEPAAILVELSNGTERARVDAARAQLDSAKAELARTVKGMRKEDVEAIVADTASIAAKAQLSQTSLQRVQSLQKTGASTLDELDRAARQAESDAKALESAEAKRKAALSGSRAEDILAARANVAARKAALDEAEVALTRTQIRAPIGGEVLQVKVRAGEYYAPGGADPLVILGDTSVLRARIDVDERDVDRVRVGAKAFVTANAFSGRRVPARVVEVGKRMGRKNLRTDDPTERIDTKILEVVAELDERDGLLPGLRVVGYISAAK